MHGNNVIQCITLFPCSPSFAPHIGNITNGSICHDLATTHGFVTTVILRASCLKRNGYDSNIIGSNETKSMMPVTHLLKTRGKWSKRVTNLDINETSSSHNMATRYVVCWSATRVECSPTRAKKNVLSLTTI